MSAIPKGLVSREALKQMPGIKCSRTQIIPSNSSGDFTYSSNGNNRIIFQIPSFENSFINTKRSYIRFKLTANINGANALVSPGAPVFRRLLLKNSRGQVLEDIDSYDTLCRIMNNMKPKTQLESKKTTHKETRVEPELMSFATGQNVIHELHSGVLGHQQEYMIPVSAMAATSGYAFQLELWLNDSSKVVFGSKTTTVSNDYTLTDVSYDVELLEVSPEIMSDINSELSQGSQIPIPYKSWRHHVSHMSSGSDYKANISESAQNVSAIYTIMRPQSQASVVLGLIEDKEKYQVNDPYKFFGGRKTIASATSDTLTATNAPQFVTKYSYKYGSKYYPLQPVDLDADSTIALENIVAGFEMDEKMPFISETLKLTDGTTVPRYESVDFMIAQNFKTTNDLILNGLNAASTGSPIEVNIKFNASVTNMEILSFVEQTNVLFISKGGHSALVSN
jgi:hypothetical protein